MSDKTEGAGTGEGKGSLLLPIRLWLWRMAAALRRRPPIAERRLASSSQTQGGDGRSKRAQEKKKKSRGSVGPSFALVRRRPEAPLPPSKSRWAAPCVAVAAQGAALLFCTLPS